MLWVRQNQVFLTSVSPCFSAGRENFPGRWRSAEAFIALIIPFSKMPRTWTILKNPNQHQVMKLTPLKSYWWYPPSQSNIFLKNWAPGTHGTASRNLSLLYSSSRIQIWAPSTGFHLQYTIFLFFYLIPPSREIWFTIAVSTLNDLVMCMSYAQLALLLLSSQVCLRSYILEVEIAENMKNNCGLCWEACTYSKALWPQILCLLFSENPLA